MDRVASTDFRMRCIVRRRSPGPFVVVPHRRVHIGLRRLPGVLRLLPRSHRGHPDIRPILASDRFHHVARPAHHKSNESRCIHAPGLPRARWTRNPSPPWFAPRRTPPTPCPRMNATISGPHPFARPANPLPRHRISLATHARPHHGTGIRLPHQPRGHEERQAHTNSILMLLVADASNEIDHR